MAIPGKLKELERIGEKFINSGIKFRMQIKKDYRNVREENPFVEYNNEEAAIIKKFNSDFGDKNKLSFTGKKCWAGSKYLILDANGNGWRCFPAMKRFREYLGNILEGTLTLRKGPEPCPYKYCDCRDPINCHMMEKNN